MASGSDPFGAPGNAVLAGHRHYLFGRMFSRLDEVDVGDSVEIFMGEARYHYTVFRKLTVQPQDLSVLEDIEGKSILTLITCTPMGKSTHRLIVQAPLD